MKRQYFPNRMFRVALATCAVGLLSVGCTGMGGTSDVAGTGSNRSTPEGSALASGVITIARPLPAAAAETVATMGLGFLPSSESHDVAAARTGFSLVLNKKNHSLSLLSGASVVSTVEADGIEALPAGKFEVVHKQRSPLWYAPDSYFTARQLDVPKAHDKERFRKGALGEFALFIDKNTAIHSGPIYTPEVGGVRLPERALADLYYRVPVGSIIEVR